MTCMLSRFLFPALVFCANLASAAPDDFRPAVAEAIRNGEKRIVIPPGRYLLAPEGGGKVVWSLNQVKDLEIIADGVTLVSTKLTRALNLHQCAGLTIQGLTVDYDPLPFTQGVVAGVAEDHSWIDVKLHDGYPEKPYARIDVVDPATRFRKKGMPFLWGTKAELRGDRVVRVTLKGIGKATRIGDLASLNTGPASDGIPHAVSIDRSTGIVFKNVSVLSAPGMGILECDGEGGSQFTGCWIVPGPPPTGATEKRLLSTSWDAFQSKTIRRGPIVKDCEIREAGDDSWSVQSSDYMVLRSDGPNLLIASRDEYTEGVQVGDRLLKETGGTEVKITGRKKLRREGAGLPPDLLEKLTKAESWSIWKTGATCFELTLDRESPFPVGTSLFSPDRMGNGFVFSGNRIHSSGRVLIKAGGLIEGNTLEMPHGLSIAPEVPGGAAAGIDGLVIRNNIIRRAGWFCTAPWSAAAGTLNLTSGLKPPGFSSPGVFSNIVIEGNTFEDCPGTVIVATSVKGLTIRNNRFIGCLEEKGNDTGASYGIPRDRLIWVKDCDGVQIGDNPITKLGAAANAEPVSIMPAGR